MQVKALGLLTANKIQIGDEVLNKIRLIRMGSFHIIQE